MGRAPRVAEFVRIPSVTRAYLNSHELSYEHVMHNPMKCNIAAAFTACCLAMLGGSTVLAAPPAPAFETVFPAGGQAGQAVNIIVTGSNLEALRTLHCNVPGFRCDPLEPNHFCLTIPASTPPGMYDLWAVSGQGVSAPRAFFIGNRPEQLEAEANDSLRTAPTVPLDVVINGRIEKAGDVDHFRFAAKRGQRVIIECWADRIDSRLRAVLEVFDSEGRRLAVNRGYFGIDPLIDFRPPSDGEYIVKVQDLISAGGADHYYRLDLDTGPRVAFTVPTVVERGKSSRITLYGWNLTGQSRNPSASDLSSAVAADGTQSAQTTALDAFDRIEVDVPASLAEASWPLPVRFAPVQAVFAGFAYHLPGSHAAVALGVTDVPVVLDRPDNHSPAAAQLITCPCEVSGQLVADDERDWYSISALRGEVLHIEVLAHRINSPVDLDVSVLDASGVQELAQFSDEVHSIGGSAFPTSHLDPAGRWVVPADGPYLIAVRNLSGGVRTDPRRTYRLSVRREDPDFQVVTVPHSDGPVALNVRRGGRELLDLLAFRRRGFAGPIRIAARDLPEGIECPDVWLGPGVERATLVVSADRNAPELLAKLKLEAFAEELRTNPKRERASGLTPSLALRVGVSSDREQYDGTLNGTVASASPRPVRGGTVVRSGAKTGWGRLTSEIPLAVAGEAPLRIAADGHETLDHHLYGKLQVRHSPGGILDVAVEVERRDADHQAQVSLIGVGLPELIGNQTAVIPAGQSRGYLSFYLPATLPVGQYSLAVRAETTVPTSRHNTEKKDENKTETRTAYSNCVTFEVQPEAFLVEVDPFAPARARRGEVVQVRYEAHRRNGFIGKMHTELAAPGRVTNVAGLRGRGETFVGQVDKGSLQIVVNDDAPLGRQPFLRLFTVGVREDQPIYFGSCFLPLEIVE